MIHIVLYEPEIPANTGNIMRTCAATGCDLHLIEPLGFSLDEERIRRSGMDYREHMHYEVWPNWETFYQGRKGTFFYVTRYGHKSPDQFNLNRPKEDLYLVFGKESTGIDKQILKDNLQACMRLPMKSEIRSLNLSNCVAIVLYEALRQQGYPGLSLDEVIKGPDFLENQE